jgi:mRNA-degrading endonuclease RelE of RelBE toxin-antitoxin system
VSSGAPWRVELTRSAERDLRRLDPPVRARVADSLHALAENPQRSAALRKLTDAPEWRLRIGDWRALVLLDVQTHTVVVTRRPTARARLPRLTLPSRSAGRRRGAPGRLHESSQSTLDNAHYVKLPAHRQLLVKHARLKLIRQWLQAGVMDEEGALRRTVAGTPQGGVISPLLSNIYLQVLDRAFADGAHGTLVRYADDFGRDLHKRSSGQGGPAVGRHSVGRAGFGAASGEDEGG